MKTPLSHVTEEDENGAVIYYKSNVEVFNGVLWNNGKNMQRDFLK
jgi:hypothetical protein